MTHKSRNVIVGLTVIFALGALGWMVFKFAAAPAKFFRPAQITLQFESDRGDGLGDGSTIYYRGVEAGRVTSVTRDPASDKIRIDAFVNKEPPLPANVYGNISFASPLGGVSMLDLRLDGPTPQGVLAEGAKLRAEFGGSTFIPPEFAELAKELRATVRQLNDAKVVETIQQTLEITRQRIEQAGKAIEGVGSLVNDPALRQNLQQAIANINTASADAAKITGKIKTLTDKLTTTADSANSTLVATKTTVETANKRIDEMGAALGDQLRRLSSTMDNVAAITGKINTGEGTAGQLVNDPKLYQALVDSAQKLNATIGDMQRLVQQWEQEGVTLKLGK